MNKRTHIILLLCFCSICAKAEIEIRYTNSKSAFPLFDKGKIAAVCIDSMDAEVVHMVANAFCNDRKLVTNAASQPVFRPYGKEYLVLAGTLGTSRWIDSIAAKDPALLAIKGKWETFRMVLINNPYHNKGKILVIAGSDPRGTAYGLFELSRKIGVHPFHWWADIVPEKHDALFVELPAAIQQSPDVQYRGIFLNDEDWGLHPWAAKNMDPDLRDIGPNTYEKVFELLLRLKANYIWPAMHHCTKAFWYYKQNPELARRYAIVLGASHCEPMLRNNVSEWVDEFKNEYGTPPGEWRYDLNKQQIYPYWSDRVKAAVDNEAVYTIGMRGIHDGSMPGPAGLQNKKALMEQVISDQRILLQKNLHKPAAQTPQIFCPYKEVLDIYQAGMNLPDDITIAWADDNHGYIRQLSDPSEQKRAGRSGVYYHLSYFGRPSDYLWLSSISPALISYEMTKAYQFTADKLWVFNVGDIKPAELELQFAMDLAWNVKEWPAGKAQIYVEKWAEDIFGKKFSKAIAGMKEQYYQLAAAAKPEHLNKVSFSTQQARERVLRYRAIAGRADSLKKYIPEQLQDAYYQLLYYPVMGAKLMNEKILLPRLTAKGRDKKENQSTAMDAYNQIQALTNTYNTAIANGKWNGMMSAAPRKQAVFNKPDSVTDAKDKKNIPVSVTEPAKAWNAAAYTNAVESGKARIQTIKGLGITGNGVTTSLWNSYDTANIAAMPSVSYPLTAEAGDISLQVKCLPTFRLYAGLKLRYGIALGNEKPQWISIETNADTDDWSRNVLRGFAAGLSKHHSTGGATTVTIYFPDPGLVINQIEIL